MKGLAGLVRVSILARKAGPPGRDIDIRLSGGSPAALKSASRELRELLSQYPGVSDLEDNLPYGRNEVLLTVSPRGRALGFTTESVSRQVRDAFEGRIAKRFARGDEKVAVRVQYDRDGVAADALRDLYLRSPTGAEVPISEVARFAGRYGLCANSPRRRRATNRRGWRS